MFVTEDRFRSPMSGLLSNPGQQTWLIGELMLNLPWFVVTLQESNLEEDEWVPERTVFASSILQVEQWAAQEAVDRLKFESVMIVTPGNQNKTGTWQMEPLVSIWLAEEDISPGSTVEVCETKSGARYATSFCGTTPDKLVNYKLRHQFVD